MAKTLRTVLSIDTKRFKAGLNNAKASVRGFNQAIVRPLANIVRSFVRLSVVVGAVAGAFAVFGIKAAAAIQQAKMRMAGISSGVEDFRKTWKDTYDVFLRSPLDLDESVKSMITLKNAGVGTKGALEAVAGAAMLLGRSTEDLSLALLSMESKTLKRMGFAARSIGAGANTKFEITGLDKAGNKMSRFADNIEDARKNLIELLTIKYGGALEAMSRTLEGVMSTFRGVRQMAFHEIFKSTLETLSPLIMMLNDQLIRLSESGALAKLGEKIADFAVRSISAISRLIHTIRNFNLRKWAMDNMGILAALGSVFVVVFGIKATSAIMAAIQAIKLMPLVMQKSLGIMAAAMAGWQIGRILDKKFDISHHVAKWMLGIKAMMGATADFVMGRGSEAVDKRFITLQQEIDLLNKNRAKDAQAAAEAAKTKGDEWITKAFEKYKLITPEELAARVAGLGAGDDLGIDDEAGKGWRDIINESARRGIGKVFGGGAMVEGTEEKRTKAALAMVKRQETTNELLGQVVRGFNIDNRRIGALAF